MEMDCNLTEWTEPDRISREARLRCQTAQNNERLIILRLSFTKKQANIGNHSITNLRRRLMTVFMQ
jgi:hypothetical protein